MKKTDLKRCGQLFLKFFRIGLFTFGGGYAMIPLIRREIVENEKWLTDDDLLDILAVSESTPGPVAINTATFVGYKLAGPFAAACATMGVVLPSFTIIFILSFVLRQFEQLKVVKYAFWGIRAAVLSLVLNALISMAKSCWKKADKKNIPSYILAALAFTLVVVFNASTILTLAGCALIGIAAYRFRGEGSDK